MSLANDSLSEKHDGRGFLKMYYFSSSGPVLYSYARSINVIYGGGGTRASVPYREACIALNVSSRLSHPLVT